MRPEDESRRFFGITRSKGKMYELGLPEESHIAVPEHVEPAALFPLTIGTLIDACASVNDAADVERGIPDNIPADIGFAASFLDAYLESRFDTEISNEVTLLASASYFLGQRPGSSLVLARRLGVGDGNAVEQLVIWVLQARWNYKPTLILHSRGLLLNGLADRLMGHFNDGLPIEPVITLLENLRSISNLQATSHELVLVEILSAVIRLRLASSAWTLLPGFTGLAKDAWASAIVRPAFPKELWPSQKLLGRAGIFDGRSGVVQMPTSAGKTRSVEIILRSAFLSGRTRVAVLVAPFRALCHEIATSFRQSFMGEEVKVNELSDALQFDFADQLAEIFGQGVPTTSYLLVLTPEKLLYVLRQEPGLIGHIGVVVYDEGHQFDTGSRGITYELLLTEIKGLLQATAQTVLLSAVIQNATAVGEWLIGVEPNIVDGRGLLSTARAVAFATWRERLGQLQFFESATYENPDYFVPRSIEAQQLDRLGRERNARFFPERGADAWKDVSLYLGIRLAPNGTVAVFCGRKDTASGLAKRAVEVYERGFNLPSPAEVSNSAEIRRLVYLAIRNFGENSTIARAAALGIFVHHGTTPQGLRLSIEYGMQGELIKLVVCTSTLAQGVNLPIRYLIVSGVNQGAERIKTRDFQNLIGRAGRAGMHTEGIVLFADPRIIDKRRVERWRFRSAIELLQPENSEDTSSSLLELLAPIYSTNGTHTLPATQDSLLEVYFLDDTDLNSWATRVATAYQQLGFTARFLVSQISRRQRLLTALESYLMANRGPGSFDEFKARAKLLATLTLAYALAKETEKAYLVHLFELVAEYLNRVVPEPERQAMYSKTLLSANKASIVESWVRVNEIMLRDHISGADFVRTVWPLFQVIVDNKHLTRMKPDGLAFSLAEGWMLGASYHELITMALDAGGTKPWGDDARRRLTDADVLEFLEGCLGFDCPLVIAALGQFLFGSTRLGNEDSQELDFFQKSLKYGLPNRLAISAYEAGFSDRSVAQDIASALQFAGYDSDFFDPALTDYREVVANVLASYPSYFIAVLESL